MSTPKTSLSLILTQAKDMSTLETSFLDLKDLGSLSSSCKQFQIQFSKTLITKKKASILLKYVFDADPKKVQEFLSTEPKHIGKEDCVVLTKSVCHNEGYVQPGRLETSQKRIWKNISPLEAAAWCGDNYLVKDLLNYVPESQYNKAATQLQGILDRKETAENGVYLAPFRNLIQAYRNYMEKVTTEEQVRLENPLWAEIGACQHRLSVYGLQEFCDKNAFSPVPNFKSEPRRSCLCKGALEELPLPDADARLINNVLYKVTNDFVSYILHGEYAYHICEFDLTAFNQLCEVRASELRVIISQLVYPLLDESVTGEIDMVVYKIVSQQNLKESLEAGFVKPSPLDVETNFIHMCSEDQIEMIVSKFWKNKDDVVILKLDSEKLEGRLVKEKNPGGSTEYYHLYDGKIPISAVIETKIYSSAVFKKS